MLLGCLLAFAFIGLVSQRFASARMPVVLLLSAGSVALVSPPSLLFCSLIAILNFVLLRSVQRRSMLLPGICLNLFALISYHAYTYYYQDHEWVQVLALAGVSFLALQHIDHLFRVHHKIAPVPTGFFGYMAAVLYLPKFFSGPVAVLPSVAEQIVVSNQVNLYTGLNRILLGIFKKLVLAESLAISTHSVFDFKDAYPGLTLLLGAFLYALQLYFDFSGYTDIAVGSSMIWGITLPENFNFPFRQKSWSEFWKSWHASLTQWLWQYLFNPLFLFFERHKLNRKLIFLFCALAVFAGMALFNGMQSGYFISAGLFALFYVCEQWFKIPKLSFRAVTIFIFFSFALIFFRNPAHEDHMRITHNLFSHFAPGDARKDLLAPLASGGAQQDYFNFSVTLVLSLLFIAFERRIMSLISANKINYVAWFILLILVLTWGVFDSGERFIYMQF